jgi:hypothetical protein
MSRYRYRPTLHEQELMDLLRRERELTDSLRRRVSSLEAALRDALTRAYQWRGNDVRENGDKANLE